MDRIHRTVAIGVTINLFILSYSPKWLNNNCHT
jgi:hypothetical protein